MSDNGAHFVNASAEMDMCLSRNGSQENWWFFFEENGGD